MDWGSGITYLAETNLQGRKVRFGIKDRDRLEHVALIGRSGSGRASLMTQMALQDIARGVGTIVLDASGNFAESLLERLPEEARERLIYLDPSDAEFPFVWNALDDFRSAGEAGLPLLKEALAALYRASLSPLIEFAAEEMFHRKDATLLFLYDITADMHRREEFLPTGTPQRSEFESILAASRESAESVIGNGRYLAKDSLMRNLLGQSTSKFSLRPLALGGVIVVDVSRIRVFPTRVIPLVRLFVHAARARTVSESTFSSVSCYLFDTARCLSRHDVEHILTERRIAFTTADSPYTDEDKERRANILARSGSVVAFSPNHTDALLLSRTFFPYVGLEDLYALTTDECVVLLSIDAVRSRPFFASSFSLPDRQNVSLQDIQTSAREKFSLARRYVDRMFIRKVQPVSQTGGQSTDPNSFSNAFRSIFAKSAGTTGTPPAPLQGAPQPTSPSVPRPPEKTKTADANGSPNEIPEDELRDMLYVKPISF